METVTITSPTDHSQREDTPAFSRGQGKNGIRHLHPPPCCSMKSPINKSHLAGAAMALSLILPSFSQAATTFDVIPWTTDASTGITSDRTYTHAYFLAPTTTGTVAEGEITTVVLNGVTFTGLNPAHTGGKLTPSLNSSVAGAFTTTQFDQRHIGSSLSNNISSKATGIGYDASRLLARNRFYAASLPSNNPVQTLTLSGLAIGQEYQLSLFTIGFTDNRSVIYSIAGASSDVYLFGGSSSEATYGQNNGAIVNITYTATDTSMTLSLTSTGGSSHLYAFANAVVPEPTRALLSLLGIGMFTFRRQRWLRV
jgi:hypothetical protein